MTADPGVRLECTSVDADEWRVVAPAPGVNAGFQERRPFVFRADGAALELFVDDEPLTPTAANVSQWVWSPRFYAGEVTAQVKSGSSVIGTYLLDVSPDPGKLGRDAFAQMIDELSKEDPALLVGNEPAQQLVGTLGAFADPWLAFARLRRYGPQFVAALGHVRQRPRRTLTVTRRQVGAVNVRRVDRHTVALMSPSSRAFFYKPEAASMPAGERFDTPYTEDTLDGAANRCLHVLVRAVLQRSRLLSVELERLVAHEQASETRSELGSRWPERRRQLELLERYLEAKLRESPLRDVTRPEVTAAGLNAIAADPVYARAWGRGWRAIRHGVDIPSDMERMWVSPSWQIYERWCFLRVRQWLQTAFSEWQWRRGAGLTWVGSRGNAHAQLLMQPKFVSGPGRGRWSVSREREPDILLTVTRGTEQMFVPFDAKYSASRSAVLKAMASAHIYRDSLRLGNVRPKGALLFAPAGGGASWLESPEFQEEHRVGICVVAPGTPLQLPPFVTVMMGDAASGALPTA